MDMDPSGAQGGVQKAPEKRLRGDEQNDLVDDDEIIHHSKDGPLKWLLQGEEGPLLPDWDGNHATEPSSSGRSTSPMSSSYSSQGLSSLNGDGPDVVENFLLGRDNGEDDNIDLLLADVLAEPEGRRADLQRMFCLNFGDGDDRIRVAGLLDTVAGDVFQEAAKPPALPPPLPLRFDDQCLECPGGFQVGAARSDDPQDPEDDEDDDTNRLSRPCTGAPSP